MSKAGHVFIIRILGQVSAFGVLHSQGASGSSLKLHQTQMDIFLTIPMDNNLLVATNN